VAHHQFSAINMNLLKKQQAVVYDVKGFLDPETVDGRL